MGEFRTNFRVYFEDLSPAGIVHLEKIAEWISMTREEALKAACNTYYMSIMENPVKMFTTNLSINIIDSVQWTDNITAILSTSNIKKISFEINVDFNNYKNNQNIIRSKLKVVFVDWNTKKFTPVPEEVKDVALRYLKKR